jgi:aspartate racemase
MKTIGLIGGMSWESTVTYYQLLNRLARERLGGLHSAELLLWSFDFAEIEALQAAGDWDAATARMTAAAEAVARGGADCLVICTNTMHKMAEAVQAEVNIPLIHIADATAAAIKDSAVKAPLLLATRYTMEQDFYKGRLQEKHGIAVTVPDAAGRTLVHDIIYSELCQGIVSAESKARYLDVVRQAEADGADAVIFGCTEVGLLVSPADFDIPAFDTTELHARAALDFALGT